MTLQSFQLQDRLDKISIAGFISFLKDNGFSKFQRRSSGSCPFARYVDHLLADEDYCASVGGPFTDIYCKAQLFGYNPIKAASYPHAGANSWIAEFVHSVDCVADAYIEGWQALQIMEDIEAKRKPPEQSQLSVVRDYTFKQLLQRNAQTIGQAALAIVKR